MQNLSHTEENYLKAIFHLSEDGESVTTNALAASMSTTPASVNDMMKRLSNKGLISHVKYKGASITPTGKKVAVNVIRKHRLWEVFLVDKLKFQWDEVHDIAEQLEHIKSPILTERLDDFLGNPTLDPHGDPIPDSQGNFNLSPQVSIQDLEMGESGILVGVTNDDSSLLQHLDNMGIRLGIKIEVRSKSSFDHSITAVVGGNNVFISREVAEYLMMTKP